MTRPTTRRTNNNRNRNDQNRKPQSRKTQQQPNKCNIFLKSMVVMLGIVFVTLIAAFFIIQSQTRYISADEVRCSRTKTVQIKSKIDEIVAKDTKIFILTKPNDQGLQDLIKLDGKCLSEIGRILFKNKSR